MKGAVFTLDALFALMLAVVGIGIILYLTYDIPSPFLVQYSSASALINELSSTKLKLLTSVPLVQMMTNQSMAYNQSWYEELKDNQGSAGNPTGPSLGLVAYSANLPYSILNGSIVAGYGNIYFGAGPKMYALNATTGATVWTSNTPANAVFAVVEMGCKFNTPIVNATALYDGMVIYTTQSSTVALNARNGSTIWTSPVLYNPSFGGDVGEPDCDENTMHLLISNGKVVTGSQDEINDPSGYPLYALYASNGTLAGVSTAILSTSTPPQIYAQHTAIYKGLIATTIQVWQGFFGNPYKYYLQLSTPIINQTYTTANVWVTPSSSSQLSNIAIYGNIIAVGSGSTAQLYSGSTGTVTASFAVGAPINGVSSNNGHFIFESTTGVTSLNSSGILQWSRLTTLPVTSLTNQTPIQSSHNVYTPWGQGYVQEQNLSTGIVSQTADIPFWATGINVNPYPTLAYGKLFTSVGSHLVAFGTCQVDANASALSAIATLYINNEGSCADYILNSLQNTQNTTFTVNNKSIITTSMFNGANSLSIIPYSPTMSLSAPFSVSLWFSSNVLSTTSFDSELIDTMQAPSSTLDTMDLQLIGGNKGGSTGIHGDIGNGASWLSQSVNYPFKYGLDQWYNLVAVYTTTGWTLYIDGNAISGAYSGTPSLLDGSANIQLGFEPGFDTLKGSMANVQIYGTKLSAAQAKALYKNGISGPPVYQPSLVAWFPLAGDQNGYSATQFFPGFASQVTYNDATYNASSIPPSYSITSQSVPLVLLNYTTGKYTLYSVGAYSWR